MTSTPMDFQEINSSERILYEEYSALFELSTDLIAIADADKRFVHLNPAWEKLLGYTLEELKSRPFIDFLHPEDIQKTLSFIEEASKDKEDVPSFINRYRCKKGGYKWLEWKARFSKYGKKIYTIARDITKAKEQELLLAYKQKAVAYVQQKVERISDRPFLEKVTESLAYAVEATAAFIGRYHATKEEVEMLAMFKDGKVMEPITYNISNSPCIDIIEHGFASKLSGARDCFPTNPYLQEWGIESYIGISLYNSKKEPIGVMITLFQEKLPSDALGKDVLLAMTPRISLELERMDSFARVQESEKELNSQNDFLKKANAELDNFVYRVSHDLRAPISSSLGLLEIIREEQDNHMKGEYLDMMGKALRKQDAFIRDILDYSRNTRMELSKDDIQWKSLLQDLLSQLQHMPEREKVDLRLNIDQEVPFFSDKKRICVILNNLIANSIRYNNPYEESPYLKIEMKADKQGTHVLIADNGIGIAKEHQAKIFDMFYRANDRKPGSGLGLYIVKESIQKLSGTLEMTSELGVGTSFEMYLPNLGGE